MAKYTVFTDNNKRFRPRTHEDFAAQIIADYFESDIIFIRRRESKTPDLYILKTHICWELKSPMGNSKHTIQNSLRKAKMQSDNIILDLTRCGLTDSQSISRVKHYLLTEVHTIKKLKVITKTKEIIDIL